MLKRVDHIDIKTSDLFDAESFFLKLGLIVIRRFGSPRNSIEMALPGDNQLVFEIRLAQEGQPIGVSHIGFASEGSDVEDLEKKGIKFACKNRFVSSTGRTVSNIVGFDNSNWQLSE